MPLVCKDDILTQEPMREDSILALEHGLGTPCHVLSPYFLGDWEAWGGLREKVWGSWVGTQRAWWPQPFTCYEGSISTSSMASVTAEHQPCLCVIL